MMRMWLMVSSCLGVVCLVNCLFNVVYMLFKTLRSRSFSVILSISFNNYYFVRLDNISVGQTIAVPA